MVGEYLGFLFPNVQFHLYVSPDAVTPPHARSHIKQTSKILCKASKNGFKKASKRADLSPDSVVMFEVRRQDLAFRVILGNFLILGGQTGEPKSGVMFWKAEKTTTNFGFPPGFHPGKICTQRDGMSSEFKKRDPNPGKILDNSDEI